MLLGCKSPMAATHVDVKKRVGNDVRRNRKNRDILAVSGQQLQLREFEVPRQRAPGGSRLRHSWEPGEREKENKNKRRSKRQEAMMMRPLKNSFFFFFRLAKMASDPFCFRFTVDSMTKPSLTELISSTFSNALFANKKRRISLYIRNFVNG